MNLNSEEFFDCGNRLFQRGEYALAIDAYLQAELLAPSGTFLDATFNRASAHGRLGQLAEAVKLFEQVEDASPAAGALDSTLYRASSLEKLGRMEEALAAYQKAEADSANRFSSLAVLGIGSCLHQLKRHEQALQTFENFLQKGSSEEDFASAHFGRGLALGQLQRHEEAIIAYEQAELCSPGGHFPVASFNKGIDLRALQRFAQAVEAFEKAEADSPDGQYPEASFFKGEDLELLHRPEEALLAYTKAEQDSPAKKYPKATLNKGGSLFNLGRMAEGIEAVGKAEQDSVGGAFPEASYRKAQMLYYGFADTQKAIRAVQKAIDDSPGQHYPDAHLLLAKLLVPSDPAASRAHAFIALRQDCRQQPIVEYVFSNHSTRATGKIYQQRLHYLDLELEHLFMTNGAALPSMADWRKFAISQTSTSEDLELFRVLLQTPSVSFPNAISYRDRLQLSYLISYLLNEPWRVFQVIDQWLDRDFDLHLMDQYFYAWSAYQIGEPMDELSYFTGLNTDGEQGLFSQAFQSLQNQLSTALKEKNLLDPYLLNIIPPALSSLLPADEIHRQDFHPWINQALECALRPGAEYQLPLSEKSLHGLSTQLLRSMVDEVETDKHANTAAWVNFKNALAAQPLNYAVLLENIRTCTRKNIPYQMLLSGLFESYQNATNDLERNNLALMQASVIIAHYFEFERSSLLMDEDVKILTESVAIGMAQILLASLVATGPLLAFGVGLALSKLSGIGFRHLHQKIDVKKLDTIFAEIMAEVEC